MHSRTLIMSAEGGFTSFVHIKRVACTVVWYAQSSPHEANRQEFEWGESPTTNQPTHSASIYLYKMLWCTLSTSCSLLGINFFDQEMMVWLQSVLDVSTVCTSTNSHSSKLFLIRDSGVCALANWTLGSLCLLKIITSIISLSIWKMWVLASVHLFMKYA